MLSRREQVDFSSLILTNAFQVLSQIIRIGFELQLFIGPGPRSGHLRRIDLRIRLAILGEAAEDIAPLQVRQAITSIDIPTDNGYGYATSFGIGCIDQLDDWIDEGLVGGVHGRTAGAFRKIVVRAEAMGAFFYIPAVVAAFGDVVYLFIQGLARIACYQLVVPAHIKGEAIGVPEAIGIYLRPDGCSYKGVIGGDRVSSAIVDVYAQDISQQIGIEILAIAAGIDGIPVGDMSRANVVLITAVADGNIQEAVRAKFDGAAVVVGLWMVFFQDDPFRAHIGLAAIRGDLEF